MSRRNCAGPHDAGGALTLVMAGQPLHLRRSVELLTNLPAASPSVLGIPEQALHPAVSAPRAAVNHMGQYADPRTAHDAGAITPPAEGGGKASSSSWSSSTDTPTRPAASSGRSPTTCTDSPATSETAHPCT